MFYKELISHKPEQIFLIQGDVSLFEKIADDFTLNTKNVEKINEAKFTTEDAKYLVEFNLERPENSWCVVYFDTFVSDAAQILLKTLEEPRENIFIVFVTPHPYLIPQTIRSRVRLIISKENSNQEIPDYLKSKKEILEYIKVFGNDDIEAATRRGQATVLLDQLEQYFKDDKQKIKSIYEAKDMLFKANMPTKQVIEFVVTMVY
jgi:DNA polymerase III delta prime subunit